MNKVDIKYKVFVITEKFDPDTYDDYKVPVSWSKLYDHEFDALCDIEEHGELGCQFIILPVYIKTSW